MEGPVTTLTEADVYPLRESALLEIGLWVKSGATPWQTLLAATRNGAALCGVETDLGPWNLAR